MIKAVVFDWGGVLSENPTNGLVEYFSKTLGASKIDLKEALNEHIYQFQTGQISENDMWTAVCSKLDVNKPERKSLWGDGMKEVFIDREEMFELMKTLRNNGFKVGLLSNTEKIVVEHFNEKGFKKYFDAFAFSCIEGVAKPDRKIYEIILDRLGVQAEETVFVDDLEVNVEGARKVGMKGILFEDYERLVEKLKSFGVEV